MVFSAVVLYPAGSDATFDLSYYLKSHMPFCSEKWTPFGLMDWKVIEFAAGPDGSKPYSIGTVLTFETADSVKTVLASNAGKVVMDDVPNFSNKSPIFLNGDTVAAS